MYMLIPLVLIVHWLSLALVHNLNKNPIFNHRASAVVWIERYSLNWVQGICKPVLQHLFSQTIWRKSSYLFCLTSTLAMLWRVARASVPLSWLSLVWSGVAVLHRTWGLSSCRLEMRRGYLSCFISSPIFCVLEHQLHVTIVIQISFPVSLSTISVFSLVFS